MTKRSAFGTALLMGDDGRAFVATAVDDLFTATAHGLVDTTPVMLQGATLPGGVAALTVYFVRDATANTFKLAATSGGAAINLTADGSGTVRGLAEIAQVRNIGGPSLQVGSQDVTTHDQATAFREKIPTLIDGGQFALDLVFDPAQVTHIAILEDLVGRVKDQAFALVFPDLTATTWSFTGFIVGLTPDAPVDGDQSAAATVELTGAADVT